MSNTSKITLVLVPPAQISVQYEEHSGPLYIGGQATTGGTWPPWPVAPDILCRAETHTFAGITCGIHDDYRSRVKNLCERLSPEVARYNSPDSGFSRDPYGDDDTHYFEVLWAQGADTFLPAQLAEDGWFYTVRDGSVSAETFDDWAGEPMSRLSLVAVEIRSLGKLLTAYDLVFPETFVLPLTMITTL